MENREIDALDALIEVLDPAQEIFGDEKVQAAVRGLGGGVSVVEAIKIILLDHKQATWELLAAIKGVGVDDYKRETNLKTLVLDFIEITKDEELMRFFGSLRQ